MPFWGKILGFIFGFMFLKIPGAIIGVFIGHLFDKGYSQDFSQTGGFGRFFSDEGSLKKQAIFFHSLFAALGHLAKSDGKVTQAEIAVATALMDDMQLTGEARQEAQQAFREGKEADYPVADTLKRLYESCHGRRDILQVFVEILIQCAFSDGQLSAEEYGVLEKVSHSLGFRRQELDYLVAAYEAEIRFRQHGSNRKSGGQRRSSHYDEKQSIRDAYAILGIGENSNQQAIKRAYRKKMSEHHPDKLAAKGLPPQAMEIAKNKAQDIQAAYELLKQKVTA